MKAKICNSHDELIEAGPGAVHYFESVDGGHLQFICPRTNEVNACSGFCHVRVSQEPGSHGPQTWNMTGWPDAVTLIPSVFNCAQNACNWHGWLRNGEWVSV